jgi:hypothetical protein
LLLRRLSLSSNKTSSRLPTLKRLEEELLFKLTNVQGDILSDIALIEILKPPSKKISLEIAAKVIIAKAIGKPSAAGVFSKSFLTRSEYIPEHVHYSSIICSEWNKSKFIKNYEEGGCRFNLPKNQLRRRSSLLALIKMF